MINQGTGAGQIGVAGNTITYSGSVIGTFNGGVNGGNLVVFFTSDAATPAAVQALTRAIAFTNNSDSPSQTPRQLLVVLGDGDGNANGGSDSTIVSEIITVQAINDAPVVSGAVKGMAIEDGAVVTLNALANASDVDADTTLSVVGLPASLPAGIGATTRARIRLGSTRRSPPTKAWQPTRPRL